MRSKYFFVIFISLIICNFSAHAARKSWGLGAAIGSPTGLSINYFLDEIKSVHTVMAFDFNDRNEVDFASHLTWWKKDADMPLKPVYWFYGFGGEIVIIDQVHKKDRDKNFELGPSATLGLFYDFESAPLEVFLKSNLTMNIIETTNADLDLMLGLHFCF